MNTFPFAVAVGTVLGFLSGLGIGGGSLLVLWLTSVAGTDAASARTINLLFFLPSAIITCLFRWKQGTLPYRKIFPAIIAGCVGAIITTIAFSSVPTELLKKLFGGFLIVVGLKELFYRQRNAK